ncbi:hypothetical protein GQ53DRAFT_821883 [Thozetella sp. PMI_491]|nr:hypothetical protein GQ53DRAFT_821883 [Thozetella sp. PMI_491]
MAGGEKLIDDLREDPVDTDSDKIHASPLGYVTPAILQGRSSSRGISRGSHDATKLKCPVPSDLRALNEDMAPRSASRVQDLIKKLEQQERKHDQPRESNYMTVIPSSRISSAGSKASFRTSHDGDEKPQQKADEDSGVDISKTDDTKTSLESEKNARVLTLCSDTLTNPRTVVSQPSPTSPISPFFEKDDLGFLEQQSYFTRPRLGHDIFKPNPEAVTVFKRIVIEKKTIDMQREYNTNFEGKSQVKTPTQQEDGGNATETDTRSLPRGVPETTTDKSGEVPKPPKTPTRVPQSISIGRSLLTLAPEHQVDPPTCKETESAQVAEPRGTELDSPILKYLSLGADYQPRNYSIDSDETANKNKNKKESSHANGNDEPKSRSIPTTNITSLDVFMRRDLIPASKAVPEPTFRDSPTAKMWRDMRSYLWADVETENPHCPEPASAHRCEEVEKIAARADRLGEGGQPASTHISDGALDGVRYLHGRSKNFSKPVPRRRTAVEIDAYVESVSSMAQGETEDRHVGESQRQK